MILFLLDMLFTSLLGFDLSKNLFGHTKPVLQASFSIMVTP